MPSTKGSFKAKAGTSSVKVTKIFFDYLPATIGTTWTQNGRSDGAPNGTPTVATITVARLRRLWS